MWQVYAQDVPVYEGHNRDDAMSEWNGLMANDQWLRSARMEFDHQVVREWHKA